MVGGVWANSNYDSQKEGQESPRQKILQEIEEGFQKAVRQIRTGVLEDNNEIDWDDPFFAAMKSPRIRTEDAIDKKERAELMKELDQT